MKLLVTPELSLMEPAPRPILPGLEKLPVSVRGAPVLLSKIEPRITSSDPVTVPLATVRAPTKLEDPCEVVLVWRRKTNVPEGIAVRADAVCASARPAPTAPVS